MSDAKLYELAQRVDAVTRRIVAAGGEIDEVLESEHDQVQEAFEEKAERSIFVLRRMQEELEKQHALQELVAARVRALKRGVDNMDRYIGNQLATAKREVVVTVDDVPVTYKAAERTETVVPTEYYADPESTLPRAVWERRTTYAIDRRMVRKLLDGSDWEAPPGIHVKRWHVTKAE